MKGLNKCQNAEGNYKIFETAKFTTDLSIKKQIKDIRIQLNKIEKIYDKVTAQELGEVVRDVLLVV